MITSFRSLVVGVGIATLGIAAGFAQTQSLPQVKAPSLVEEGIATKLTSDQMKELLPWATNSRAQLINLLNKVKNDSPERAVPTLIKNIEQIVAASSPSNNELLMRYALNRALKIVDLMEAQYSRDALLNIEMRARVLRRSAEMAVKYSDYDTKYVQGGSLEPAKVPYVEFGLEYAQLLMGLNASVVNVRVQFTLGKLGIGFLQWDLYRKAETQVEHSAAIWTLYNELERLEKLPVNLSDNELRELVKGINLAYQTSLDRLSGKALDILKRNNSKISEIIWKNPFRTPNDERGQNWAIGPDGMRVLLSDFRFLDGTSNPSGLQLTGKVPDKDIEKAVFSPDGKWIAIAVGTGAYLFNARNGEYFWTIIKDSKKIAEYWRPEVHLSFSPDSRFLLTYTRYRDRSLKIWDVHSRTLASKFSMANYDALAENLEPVFVSNTEIAIISNNSKKVLLLDTDTRRLFELGVNSNLFERDRDYALAEGVAQILVVETGNEINAYNLHTGEFLYSLGDSYAMGFATLDALTVSRDGKFVFVLGAMPISGDRMLKRKTVVSVLDPATSKTVAQYDLGERTTSTEYKHIKVTQDGKRIFVWSAGLPVRVLQFNP